MMNPMKNTGTLALALLAALSIAPASGVAQAAWPPAQRYSAQNRDYNVSVATVYVRHTAPRGVVYLYDVQFSLYGRTDIGWYTVYAVASPRAVSKATSLLHALARKPDVSWDMMQESHWRTFWVVWDVGDHACRVTMGTSRRLRAISVTMTSFDTCDVAQADAEEVAQDVLRVVSS